MAENPDRKPRKRFSKSGHTAHPPRDYPPTGGGYPPPSQPHAGPSDAPTQAYPPVPPPRHPPPRRVRREDAYGAASYYERDTRYEQRGYREEYVEGRGVPPDYPQAPPDYPQAPAGHPRAAPGASYPPDPRYPPPPTARGPAGPSLSGPAVDPTIEATAVQPPSVTKAIVGQTNRYARLVTNKVISASKADGAHESGLTALIWNQVLSYGADAMVTVALAGTVFFGASTHAQRGNVLLYLLVTVAPFAIVAPVIGPALDRLQHGRRWTMAATAIGRAVLALVMAAHSNDLLVLYPCALGSLVLSKAYSVVRAAAAPRLVPPGLTLVEANARLSIFGLVAALVFGGFTGVVIKLSGSYTFALILTAIAFGVCAYFAFRLPRQVDSADRPPRVARQPRAERPRPSLPHRLVGWARRGYTDLLVTALYGESTLRFLSALLTIFLAFYIESTAHGFQAAAELGAIAAAAGVGNFLGNAIGTRLKLQHPELVITISVGVCAAVCIVVAIVFSISTAVAGMLISAITNSLSKIALDAMIQRDVPETQRTSAFGRSETFLQLAWVLGAAVGVVLPSNGKADGTLAFWVAGGVLAAVSVFGLLRQRAVRQAAAARQAAPRPEPHPPGNVAGPGPLTH